MRLKLYAKFMFLSVLIIAGSASIGGYLMKALGDKAMAVFSNSDMAQALAIVVLGFPALAMLTTWARTMMGRENASR